MSNIQLTKYGVITFMSFRIKHNLSLATLIWYFFCIFVSSKCGLMLSSRPTTKSDIRLIIKMLNIELYFIIGKL